MKEKTVDIIIPTYKPDKRFFSLIESLENQTVKPTKIILMNTEEKYLSNLLYGTNFKEKFGNVVVRNVSKKEFNHGRTRNQGVKQSTADICVLMTQDAFPDDDRLIEKLIEPLEDDSVAVAYARQLPARDASPIEIFSRSFNYPDVDRLKGKEDLEELGIKTYFCSDVCAAYNRKTFRELGGFIDFTIFNEDMLYAAKAINSGYRVAYASKARVIHSHNYSGRQQFRRNFDLGVSQADHPEVFGDIKSEGEGIKMVKQTVVYLAEQKKIYLVPYLFYLSACKLLGYRLGKKYKTLSHNRILKCTSNPEYWSRYWDKNLVPENVYAGYGKNEEGL